MSGGVAVEAEQDLRRDGFRGTQLERQGLKIETGALWALLGVFSSSQR